MRYLGLCLSHEGQICAVEPVFLVDEQFIIFGVIVHHGVQSHLRVEDRCIVSLTYVNICPCILKTVIFGRFPSYLDIVT